MKSLTDRQSEALEFVREYITDRGFPPSVREVAAALRVTVRAAHGHLRALENKGYLRREAMKPRAIEVPGLMANDTVDVPLVGQVSAGVPVLSEQNIEDTFRFPASLVGRGPIFALRVRGDSLCEAGILDGDYVLVRVQPRAMQGEIVVALVDGETTVKRFYQQGKNIRLEPANPRMKPIVTDQATILGKVVGVFRAIP